MATDNRLRAKIQPTHADHIHTISQTNNQPETEVERELIKTGLEAQGYITKPTEPHRLFLYYINKAGLILGLVGLILIGYGIFGPRVWSLTGFSLALIGFLLIATEEAITTYAPRFDLD